MTIPSPPGPEQLENLWKHRRFLQRLAANLVHDEHAAADLVQDTWVAALERPPAAAGGLRGWLSRVVRNLAIDRRRIAARRAVREKALARSEEEPSPEQIESALELRRQVVAAVQALGEPYRTAIWLRYDEGLEPRQIASRLAIPLATVETRLRRGRAQLRTRLDSAYGDRRSWCMAFISLGSGSGPGDGALASGSTSLTILGVSIMSKSLGGAVTAALALALAWFALQARESSPEQPFEVGPEQVAAVQDPGRTEVDDETAPGHAVDGARTVIHSPLAVRESTSRPGLEVHSSAGIPIERVEVELQPRRWSWRDLDGGWLELQQGERALAVRAAGHIATEITAGAPSVVLEPDALLVIEGACLESVEITFPAPDTSRERFVGGSTTADRWVLAVSTAHQGFAVHVTVTASDLAQVFLEFDPSAGERATWKLPCEDRRPTRPLDVHVVRPTGLPGGSVQLFLNTSASRQGHQTSIDEYTWGRAVFPTERRIHFGVRVEAGESSVRLESAPVGEFLSLTARDESSGAFGRTLFAHDGSPVEIELLPPITIQGRVAASPGTNRPLRAHIWFHHHRVDEEPSQGWWYGGRRNVQLGDQGQFRFLSPEHVMPQAVWPLLPPPVVELLVQAPGFEELRTQVIVENGQVDCGTLMLVPAAEPDLVLAPGHGLEAWRVEFTYARFDRDPYLVLEVGQGRRTADGALSLRWTTKDDSGGRRIEGWHELSGEDSVMRLVPTSQSLVLDVHDSRVAFVQREDGAYERVRHASFRLDVVCEALRPGSESWSVGWRWRGIDAQVARLGRDAVGEIRTLEFEAPAEGAQLWWSSKGRPLDREDVPMRYLDEQRIELILR